MLTHQHWQTQGGIWVPSSYANPFPVTATRSLDAIEASFTRPADTTQYADGDLVANSTTAGSVVPLEFRLRGRQEMGGCMIRRVRLFKSNTTTTAATFRLHLYSKRPTVANGDNGALSESYAGYLGFVSLDMTSSTAARAFTDGADARAAIAVGAEFIVGQDILVIYGLVEAKATYTPAASERFRAILETILG